VGVERARACLVTPSAGTTAAQSSSSVDFMVLSIVFQCVGSPDVDAVWERAVAAGFHASGFALDHALDVNGYCSNVLTSRTQFFRCLLRR